MLCVLLKLIAPVAMPTGVSRATAALALIDQALIDPALIDPVRNPVLIGLARIARVRHRDSTVPVQVAPALIDLVQIDLAHNPASIDLETAPVSQTVVRDERAMTGREPIDKARTAKVSTELLERFQALQAAQASTLNVTGVTTAARN
jgi:hypothetical protein